MLSRRGFLLAGLASGGIVAVSGAAAWRYRQHRRTAWKIMNTDPRVFLSIDEDSNVIVTIKHLEMGQGIMTGLTTLVGEELDADWSQMQAKLAPGDRELFKNGLYGRQATAASTSIHNSWLQMRQIGAAARSMLVATAAEQWKVLAREITIESGILQHAPSGNRTDFGALAVAAMKQPVPDAEELRLKAPEEWRLIGTDLPRPDGPAKVDGSAEFSLDIRRDNMVHAVVARAPRFGAVLKSFDATAALEIEDVVEVVEVPSGVAVLAENSWAAMMGRAALVLEWDNSNAEMRSSDEMWSEYKELAKGDGLLAVDQGDFDSAKSNASAVQEFEFTVPFLAHASLEPLNAVIELSQGEAQVWAGCQLQTLDQWAVADTLELNRDKVRIETPFTGSSFGRRAYSRSDWIVELAHVAKASKLKRPIQVFWTREDDLAGGVYRPMALHKATVGLDKSGMLSAWSHKVVCKSLMKDTPWSIYLQKNGVDRASVGGLEDNPYVVPNVRVHSINAETPIPVGFWRSIGDSHNLFALETIVDEMAYQAGVDPVEFRLNHLVENSREAKLLKHVAKIADWGKPLGTGSGRGVALSKDHIIGKTTHIAMVAQVRSIPDQEARIEKIYVAVDCGIPINPNIIRTQVESSVSFAVSTIFHNAITHENGIVEQSNFDTYEPTRIKDMPIVVVNIMPSQVAPSGIGEAAVAPVAPAVVNAIFAASGQRHRALPLYG